MPIQQIAFSFFMIFKRAAFRIIDIFPVLFRGPPSYNPKRRSAVGWLHRAPSMSCLTLPPSPCPSDRSSAPFSSASSSLSEGSVPPGHETDTASIVTGTYLFPITSFIKRKLRQHVICALAFCIHPFFFCY